MTTSYTSHNFTKARPALLQQPAATESGLCQLMNVKQAGDE
jgi:hypothetical protein